MAAKWMELVTGSLEEKRQYRQAKARIKALPENYRTAAEAIERYLMYAGGIAAGDVLVRMTLGEDGSITLEQYASDGEHQAPQETAGRFIWDGQAALSLDIGNSSASAQFLQASDAIELTDGQSRIRFARAASTADSPAAGTWSYTGDISQAAGGGSFRVLLTLSGDGTMAVTCTVNGEAVISQSGRWFEAGDALYTPDFGDGSDWRYDADADTVTGKIQGWRLTFERQEK